MKTIFITIPETNVTRNLLRGTFWKNLNEGRNFRIVLIATKDKRDDYRKEFAGPDIVVEGVPSNLASPAEKFTAFVARNAFKTDITTFNQMRRYRDGGSGLALILKRVLWHWVGGKFLQKAIRKLELFHVTNPVLRDMFDLYKPDLVFSTLVIHPEMDIPILREAKRRGIQTIGMLRGMDNLTTHGFLRMVPDKFFLQNLYLKEQAIKWHHLDSNRLEVVGFPQNDWYFRKELIEPREAFLARLGIDPKKRVILYGAMGDYLFPKEGEVAEVFEELVENGSLPEDLVLIFRAHPGFYSPLEKIKKLKHVIPDRGARYKIEGRFQDWEMGEQEIAHLINSIVHSQMIICAGSTIALDAIALGKPAISVAFEKTKTNYWLSARRFRHHYTHYQDLMATEGIAPADSPEELMRAIRAYLENPLKDAKGWVKAKERFLEPYDGKSGERVAGEIKNLLGKN